MKVLLGLRVQIDTRKACQETPLHLAAEKGFLEAVSLLLTAGAPIEEITLTENTALYNAADNGHAETVKTL